MTQITLKFEGLNENIRPLIAALTSQCLSKSGLTVEHSPAIDELLKEMKKGEHGEAVFQVKNAIEISIQENPDRVGAVITEKDFERFSAEKFTPRMKDQVAATFEHILSKEIFDDILLTAVKRVKHLTQVDEEMSKEGK